MRPLHLVLALPVLAAVIVACNRTDGISDAGLPKTPEEVKPLKAGGAAPSAPLKGSDGKETSLKEVAAGKPTVLIFYRGGWCPYCNIHLKELIQVEGELRKIGYQLIALSPENPGDVKGTIDQNELTYKLFSDVNAENSKAFGLAFSNNGQVLPVPAVYLIDKTGKIVYAHSNPNYTDRLSGGSILKEAKANL